MSGNRSLDDFLGGDAERSGTDQSVADAADDATDGAADDQNDGDSTDATPDDPGDTAESDDVADTGVVASGDSGAVDTASGDPATVDAASDDSVDRDDTGEEAPDAERDSGASVDRVSEPDVEPASATYRWDPDGAPCERCGATAARRWVDGDAFVCADCKEW
ncbi:MAG: hypothetical protein ABEJ28_08445 [Salinigranum sp.]